MAFEIIGVCSEKLEDFLSLGCASVCSLFNFTNVDFLEEEHFSYTSNFQVDSTGLSCFIIVCIEAYANCHIKNKFNLFYIISL